MLRRRLRRSGSKVVEMVRVMVGRPLSRFFSRHHTPSETKALEVRNLTRAGEFSDIGFSVCNGEVVGLSGLIGAGRTEVARAIFGLARLDSGEVRVRGELVQIDSPEEALAKGIGYVPEERRAQGLFLPLSIERNISMTALPSISPLGFVRRAREKSLAEALSKRLDVRGAQISAPVVRLSGGNQQKVVLAKALALKPDILILDEPTRGVDIGAKAEIYRLMRELTGRGLGILMISSELQEVLGMSDRVLVMREGRIAGEVGGERMTEQDIMALATGSRSAHTGGAHELAH